MSEIVVVENLRKEFGKDIVALRNVSFRLKRGIIGLIGPNGSGKTTLIRILLGLIKPTSGKAFCLGFDCWKESRKIREKIGVMLEKPVYPNSISCKDYLLFVARLKGLSARDVANEVRRVLTFVELEDLADRRISTLSAGMQRRFSLACALIGEPELLILDEPTANMDVEGRLKMLSMIKGIYHERNVSIIISSHILPELDRVCDNVVLMKSGEVLDYGRIDELMGKYGIGGVDAYGRVEALYLHLTRRSRWG